MPPADALAALDALPLEAIPAAVLRLTARLVAAPRPEPAGASADDLLTVAEAAALLRATRRFVWDHARELGATRVSPRKFLLSRRRVLRYVEARSQTAS